MEDTKYYTPEIEEFHFGFEFEEEFKNPNWNKLCKPAIDVWEYIKLKLDTSHSISRIIGKIKINKVRVKYLDKEDIESLFNPLDVFDFKETDTKSLLFDILGNDKRHNTKITFCYVYTKVKWLMIYNKKTEEVRFSGFIKNKLELKKLLKQLDII